MSFLPPIFQALKASSAVLAYVATGGQMRIYRHGTAPQDLLPTQARITWQVIGQEPYNHLSGTPPTDRVVVQVDAWHPDSASIDAMATAVRDALEPRCHMTGVVADEREPDTKLYRIGLQFDYFWHRDE
jgi:hypothetical protein